jgi:transcriptional regulator with XRE-family HTH domain
MSTKAPNPVDKYVGSRVRMRRIMLGMSQEKLGEALGLTFQQIQKYEKGTNRVGASRIQQISEILQVPVSFLFEGGPTGTTSAEGFSEHFASLRLRLSRDRGLALTRVHAWRRQATPRHRRLVEQIAAREPGLKLTFARRIGAKVISDSLGVWFAPGMAHPWM